LHPSLITLCTLDAPFIQWNNEHDISYWSENPIADHHVEVAAAVMQNLASCVLAYLARRGSGIKVFGYYPEHTINPMNERDSNGHHYPCYAYMQSKTVDLLGMEHVIATPFGAGDVSKDIREASILNGL
jgi:hypothetical protein